MAKSSVQQTKLDFWIQNNKNVLFVGKHGVGKTAMVKEAFDRHGLNWRYFSASTMDPWVDFVGVPREKTDEKIPEQFEVLKELAKVDTKLALEWIQNNWKMGPESSQKILDHATNREAGLTYLELVRPQTFANGQIEALFFDEFNRSPKKVRNAVMELLQFKSINGMKFPNLRFIWAAINPEDDEELSYDVEKLDPAQQDRFHIISTVPYKPNTEWFRKKFGQQIADAAIQWWDDLPKEEQGAVSPRRLEYGLDIYTERGDMRDVLPLNTNVSKLITALNTGPMTQKLENLMKDNDAPATRSFLANENNYTSAMKFISKSDTLATYFYPLLPKEKLATIMAEEDRALNFILHRAKTVPVFKSVCDEIVKANMNKNLVKKIRRAFTENQELEPAS